MLLSKRFRPLLVIALAALAAATIARIGVARGSTPIGTGVVTITTRLAYESGEAAGTGMVITSSGEVLTNNHVIAGATSITVRVPGTSHTYSARVVGYDVTEDVAVLRLSGASNLKTVTADKSAAALGQQVHAVGNAGGTGRLSTATGRVTGTGRTITARDERGSETLLGLIETDAGVIAGDSGGPLYSASGKVVGMVTAASTSGSFGFQEVAASDAYAIPIAKALSIAHAIEQGSSSTRIHIGQTAFLGVQIASTSDTSGALIAGVLSGGPAATAGLRSGDVVIGAAGKTVASSSALSSTVLTKKPGDTLQIRYVDAAGTHTATVRLAAGPPQ